MTEPRDEAVKLDPEYVFYAAATTARLLSAKPVHRIKEVEGYGPVADIAEYQHFPDLLQNDVELLLTAALALADRFALELDIAKAARRARAARKAAR